MKLEFEIHNTENIEDISTVELAKIKEIIGALIQCGGLTGVKGGSTNIHFDHMGKFQRIELKYVPWFNRRK